MITTALYHQRTAALGLALIAALTACGRGSPPSGEESTSTRAKALIAAAADPCAESGDAFRSALCESADIAPLAQEVTEELTAAAQAVPESAAREIADSQRAWLESTRLACGIAEAAAPSTSEQRDCMRGAFETRLRQARDTVRQEGGFTFRTAEINQAQRVGDVIREELGLSDAVNAVEKQIRFPRIEGDTPEIRSFNRLMEQQVEAPDDFQTSEFVDYEILYAGPELVSVRFNRSDYALGAARPSNASGVVSVLMATGKALAPEDVFAAPAARWRPAIIEKARTGVAQQLRALDPGLSVPDNEIADTATKVKNWMITEDALVILFPSESIGPHALGDLEVAIPWSELRPLLNPAGPGPIAE
jgi:hypothetical protein